MIKFLIIVLSVFSLALNGASLKSFRYYKEAGAENTDQQTISAITLDGEVYSKTLKLSSDLRVIDEDNHEIPFALRHVFLKNTYKFQGFSPSAVESLKKLDNTIVITVKQKKKILAIDFISINTSSRNFEKSVSVSASNDNKSWRNIINNQAIFDYSSIIPLRKIKIKIPNSNYKFFRITIHNFSEEKISPIHKLVKEKQSGISLKEITSLIKRKTHLKINAVNLISLSKSKTNSSLKKQKYPIIISSINTKKKKTIIELKSASEPLSELTMSSSSTNFSRQLSLQASNDNKKWFTIARKNWSKSNIFKKSSNTNKITFLERRYKFYKIIIQNGDNPVLKELTVSANGNIYRLVMLGKQALKLKLYYGNSAPYPQYEIARLLPAMMDFDETKYQLSGEKLNPLFDNSLPKQAVSYKWLFVLTIILISIILIFILYKNLGKLNELEEKPENKTE